MILIIKEIIKVIERPAGPVAEVIPAGPIVREVIEEDLAVKEVIKVIEETHKVEEDNEIEEITVEEDLILSRTVIKRFSNDQVMANIIIEEDPDQTVDMITGTR